MSINQVKEVNPKLQTIIEQSDKNNNEMIDDNEMSLFLKNCYNSGCTSEEIISVTGKPTEGSLFENYLKQIQDIEQKEKRLEILNSKRQKRLKTIYDHCCQDVTQKAQENNKNVDEEATRIAVAVGILVFLIFGVTKMANNHSAGIKFAKSLRGALVGAIPTSLATGILTFIIDKNTRLSSNKVSDVRINGNNVFVENDNQTTQDTEMQEISSDINILENEIQKKRNALSVFF